MINVSRMYMTHTKSSMALYLLRHYVYVSLFDTKSELELCIDTIKNNKINKLLALRHDSH